MPGLDGLAAAAALRSEVPSCKVMIVTTFGRAGYLRRAMEAGALGFVVKDAPAEQLADAVRRVSHGERVVDPALAAATLAGGASPLTARERDALVAARDGATIADIAAQALGWNEEQRNEQLAKTREILAARHRIRFEK